jgi:hypothetical protein
MARVQLADDVDKESNTLCAVSCIQWLDDVTRSYQLS